MIFDGLAALAAGYFVGGTPTAVLAGRLRGHDIFEHGSGNMGAMNTARNVGVGLGLLVLVVDVAKGAAAALLGGWMFEAAGAVDPLTGRLVGGVGAVLGHAWSPYVRFRGGKALAAILGASLPVAPFAGGLTLLLLLALYLLSRRITFAAVASLALYPFLTGSLLLRDGWVPERAFAAATAALVVAVASIVKHLRLDRGRGGPA